MKQIKAYKTNNGKVFVNRKDAAEEQLKIEIELFIKQKGGYLDEADFIGMLDGCKGLVLAYYEVIE